FGLTRLVGRRCSFDGRLFFSNDSNPSYVQDPGQAACVVTSRHAATLGWNQTSPSQSHVGVHVPRCRTGPIGATRHFGTGGAGEPAPLARRRNRDCSKRRGNPADTCQPQRPSGKPIHLSGPASPKERNRKSTTGLQDGPGQAGGGIVSGYSR